MTRESEEARWISAEHGVEIAERSSPVSTSGFPDSPSSDAVYIDDDDAFVDALRYVGLLDSAVLFIDFGSANMIVVSRTLSSLER